MVFVSLITKTRQAIQPGGYTAIRFEAESTDIPNWHASKNLADPASALIIPELTAVGLLAGLVHWEAPGTEVAFAPTQYLARFTRDPFTDEIDSTATHDRAPTPGAQYDVFTWPMTVRDGQPLALMVAHNGSAAMTVTLAEFKVWIP